MELIEQVNSEIWDELCSAEELAWAEAQEYQKEIFFSFVWMNIKTKCYPKLISNSVRTIMCKIIIEDEIVLAGIEF